VRESHGSRRAVITVVSHPRAANEIAARLRTSNAARLAAISARILAAASGPLVLVPRGVGA